MSDDPILEAGLPASHRHFKGTSPNTTSREWLARAIMCCMAGRDAAGQRLCEDIAMDRSDYTSEQFVGYLLGLADRLEQYDDYLLAAQQLERILVEPNLATATTVRFLVNSSSEMLAQERPLDAFVRAWIAYRGASRVHGSEKSAIQTETVENLAKVLSAVADNPLALEAARQMVDGF
jgi:hypothetical protein